jgi:hypothetical protein
MKKVAKGGFIVGLMVTERMGHHDERTRFMSNPNRCMANAYRQVQAS